ncbi:glycoside hydrolase family 3 protein [Saccharothrix obliqua]|uniref:glycoside hydrolase family 3 protein n=1 Tax=Saccharothrix obliqua TaxID=2861747 RepID=UPI001C5F0FB2|nr:glycoside hydrolase family 3 protein [Saccharothrix obliqua]MBW4716388.1 glycoside hydrolase family 3 protein [Saccharothrix obliqua]
MSRRHLSTALAALLAAGLTTGATTPDRPVVGEPRLEHGCARIEQRLPELADWPTVRTRVRSGPGDEERVRRILDSMTLAEKVGQMTQPEIQSITPDEVRRYAIGSVLSGGGSWPGGDKHASPRDWLALADAYWDASKGTRLGVPVLWGIDAVHGNNNVFGATVFPHNIGLGAAHDPCLVRDVAAATADQVRVTGQDWTFAPTLAVARDDRWGRTYEGYAEDPRITRAYGYEAVRGLQGDGRRRVDVLATAKHFIGDGGTIGGKDQGVNPSSVADMVNTHGQGYYGALAAGAQTVMVSFNSWDNAELGIAEGKLHGSRHVLTDVLKAKMGFDGLVVSDWNGIGQVEGCTNASCPRAINAGVDVVMVPTDWKAFIANTVQQVESGLIPVARIDDAVTRILRVKLRAGVLDGERPSARAHAGSAKALQAKELARKAVRESLVLLKNDRHVLPLKPRAKVLVVGKSADSLQNQTGGWTLSWQGTGNTNADFPGGTTVLSGLSDALGAENVVFSEHGDVDPKGFDAVVAVLGETPYAEGHGDIGERTLEAARQYPEDVAVLDRVRGRGTPVVTVYLSGRPLLVNKELNRSDAFVAAWLPGTEGGGVADLLVRGRHSFRGTLPYSWPRAACQSPLNAGQPGYDPLFAPGYGLRSGQHGDVGPLPEDAPETCG